MRFEKLLKYLRSDMGKALVRTSIARGVAALGALALAVVIGRLYGPDGMGVYALGYSILMGAGILVRTGSDLALMRYVSQEPNSPAVILYLRWAGRRVASLCILPMIVLWLAKGRLEVLFDAPGLEAMLIGIVFALPAFTFTFVLSGFFKGVRMPATACLLENGSVALVAGLLLMLFQWRWEAASVEWAGYAYAVAVWLVVLQGGVQVWFWYRNQSWPNASVVCSVPVRRNDFNATARAFLATNIAGFMQSVLSIIIAGWLLETADLGIFKSAQQTAFLIGFILVVINAIFPPKFASLYHRGDLSGLGHLARQGALLGTLMSAPLLVVCLFFPAWLLSFFGDGFSEGAPLLRIVAVAQLINVMTGSVGFLLNMTGHELVYRNITLICSALGLLAFLVFIPVFGAVGAAWALAFVLVAQNMTALFFVWRRLGIWTLPGPNFLEILGVRASGR
ncbi:lipopolysaccharide biosynthesis protein [Alcanivorax sp.]|uniref:lipopolysaccharide biosynthesis protein n=1 Tax=Alcanivorax sp. TaxID=1872427 RepID=UPI003A93BEF3